MISKWSEHYIIDEATFLEMLDAQRSSLAWLLALETKYRLISSYNCDQIITEFSCLRKIKSMPWMKEIKRSKSHHCFRHENFLNKDYFFSISMPECDFLCSFDSFLYSASSLRNSASNTCSKSVFWGRRRRYIKIPSGVKNNTSKILKTWNISECVRFVISLTTQTTKQNQTTKKYTTTLLKRISGFIQERSIALVGKFIWYRL
jgi:hypothetical protein